MTHPGNRLPRWLIAALVFAPAVFVTVFYAWPLTTILWRGLVEGSPAEVLSDGRTWEVAWFTLWQAVASTALTIVLGLAPAHVVARYRFRARRLLLGLLAAVFVLPTVVVGAALLALLPEGLERGPLAIIAAHVVFNLAVVVRVVGTSWEQLPADLEAAASTLGAGPLTVFRRVTWPLLRPAIGAAGAIVFLFTFTSFGVVRLLGTPSTSTIEVEVWRQAIRLGRIDAAAALTLLQLAALATVVAWTTALQRRHSVALAGEPAGERARPRGRRRIYVAAVTAATAAFVGTPLLALLDRSLTVSGDRSLAAWRNLGAVEVRPGIRLGVDPADALWNSLQAAVWATAIALVIGGLAALAIDAAGRSARLLDAGLMLPLGTSAVTIGFGMLITFDIPPVDWRASWWIVPVGHALVAVPFVVRSTIGVLRSIEPGLRDAAATLGASPVRAWREVTLARLWRPMITAAALAAAVSLGEFGATSFLSRTGAETAPIAIERLLGRTGDLVQAQGYALASILAGATIAVMVIVDVGGSSARRR